MWTESCFAKFSQVFIQFIRSVQSVYNYKILAKTSKICIISLKDI